MKGVVVPRCATPLLLAVLLMTGCGLMDEDMSNCPPVQPEPDNEFQLDYELRLVTNMTTELQTELNTEADAALVSLLRQHLADIFTDFAHDVALSFYDTDGDSVRLQHDEHIMNANQASYTLNLPRRQYMHLATANVMDNSQVSLAGDGYCHTAVLSQLSRDTVGSHTTGVYSARQPLEVLENVSQSFNVHLYMANCAAVLVIDPRGHGTDGISVYTTGFATAFSICDSTYTFAQQPPVVRTTLLKGDETASIGFCSVTFPSREVAGTAQGRVGVPTRTVIETTEPFVAQPGEESLWEFRVYVPQADGSITENILHVREPLRAGQLKVVKCWLGSNGSLNSEDQTVGISVTLNWEEGGSHDVPL